MPDFRQQRSPSLEGEGRAKSAGRTPPEPMDPNLLGFWLAWHLYGGFEGLQRHLGMSRASIFRRLAAFREVFGEHSDTYDLA